MHGSFYLMSFVFKQFQRFIWGHVIEYLVLLESIWKKSVWNHSSSEWFIGDHSSSHRPYLLLHLLSFINDLTLEALGGGGGSQIEPHHLGFLALNFCCFTDCQKLWHNCSLFVNTDIFWHYLSDVIRDDVIVKSRNLCVGCKISIFR